MAQMKKQGLEPDLISYNTAINACAKIGKAEQVRKATFLSSRLSHGRLSRKPKHTRTQALEILDQLEAESTATMHSYSAAMNACIRGRCPGRAVQAFQRALAANCHVDRIMINTLLRSVSATAISA